MSFLGQEIPRFINLGVLIIVGISLLFTFLRVMGDGFKEEGTIAVDAALQAAPWVLLFYIVITYIIKIDSLYTFNYWILNLIFALNVSSTGCGAITVICRYNFSNELKGDTSLKKDTLKIKKYREYGLIFSVITTILCRLMIHLYLTSPKLYTFMAGITFLSGIITCYFYTKSVNLVQGKQNKKTKKETKDSKSPEGEKTTNEEKQDKTTN